MDFILGWNGTLNKNQIFQEHIFYAEYMHAHVDFYNHAITECSVKDH